MRITEQPLRFCVDETNRSLLVGDNRCIGRAFQQSAILLFDSRRLYDGVFHRGTCRQLSTHPSPRLSQHHGSGLQIPMHHTSLTGPIQRVGDLGGINTSPMPPAPRRLALVRAGSRYPAIGAWAISTRDTQCPCWARCVTSSLSHVAITRSAAAALLANTVGVRKPSVDQDRTSFSATPRARQQSPHPYTGILFVRVKASSSLRLGSPIGWTFRRDRLVEQHDSVPL